MNAKTKIRARIEAGCHSAGFACPGNFSRRPWRRGGMASSEILRPPRRTRNDISWGVTQKMEAAIPLVLAECRRCLGSSSAARDFRRGGARFRFAARRSRRAAARFRIRVRSCALFGFAHHKWTRCVARFRGWTFSRRFPFSLVWHAVYVRGTGVNRPDVGSNGP